MKSKLKLFLILGLMVGIFSCSETIEADEETPDPEVPTGGTPVETAPANTNYRPAFTGQTRVNSVKTSSVISSTVLTSGLSSPWGITSLPDGRLLIAQKGGTMRIVTNTGSVGAAITDSS